MRVARDSVAAPCLNLTGILTLVALMPLLSCTQESPEHRAWFVELPETTRRLNEQAASAETRRAGRLSLVEDLVIGDRGGSSESFYIRGAGRGLVAVDGQGTIFVLDSGNRRIQVFDHHGRFMRQMGRAGEGPEEFVSPIGIAVYDKYLYVVDSGRRLSVWTVLGDFAKMVTTDVQLIDLEVTQEGFVGSALRNSGGERRLLVTETSIDGSVHHVYAEGPPLSRFSRGSGEPAERVQPFIDVEEAVRFHVAVSSDGSTVYVARDDQYQVIAFRAGPVPIWAVNVEWEFVPYSEERKEELTARYGARYGLKVNDLTWPEFHKAIYGIAIDGHGHLYVFPRVADGSDGSAVDVYSKQGDLVFSGVLDGSWSAEQGPWSAAYQDYVYDIVRNETDGNYVAKRWRLVEPF